MLKTRVDAGSLPPVVNRLPSTPKVVPVNAAMGQYGGTWRMSMAGATDIFSLVRMIGYENLTRWKPWPPGVKTDVLPEVEANVAERIDIADAGRTYTFHLRPGMRWSDGHPFGADDIMFWYTDVFSNAELFQSRPIWAVRGGKPLIAEKLDDVTVVFRFEQPEGLLMQWLATPAINIEPNVPTAYPKHYLSQFHTTYTPAVANGQDWVRQFHDRANKWSNSEVPSLNALMITCGVCAGNGARVIAERNPYYWKVDPEGKQLPYIDRATFEIVSDNQVQLLKALNGDYDMVDSYLGFVTTPENKALFADAIGKIDYKFYRVLPERASLMLIALNLTHKDPVKRALFQNIDFRHGLSLAINRDEIIDLVFLGQGQPFQMVERPDSPLFDKEMATQFTQHDVAAANALLDKVGITQRNAEGIRLTSDGRPLRITVECSTLRQPWVDSAQLVKRYWREVGVELFVNTESTALLNQHVSNNDHDAAIWSAAAGTDTIFDPKYYFPFSLDSYFATPWARAYQRLPGAETPPAPALRQSELYDKIQNNLLTAEQRIAVFREIIAIAKQQFYTIGIVQPTDDYGIINRRMRNVPDTMSASTQFPHPGPVNPEQFWFSPT